MNDKEIRQLQVNCHNQEHIIKDLQKRLKVLYGCQDFGGCDGMNGSCVDCSYDNKELWEKCIEFSRRYWKIKE